MRLVNQGMVLGEMEFTGWKREGIWVSPPDGADGEKYERVKLDEDRVEKKGDHFVLKENASIRVDARAYKMSKSRGNVINPDQVVEKYGADSMRLYEMFMGPLEATKPWSMRGVEGVYRFLGRVWRLVVDDRADDVRLNDSVQRVVSDRDTKRKLHQTIKKVTEDLDGMRFNTAISAMMELANHLTKLEVRPRSVLETFVLLLSPFAPHLGEELWAALGQSQSLAYERWPEYDEALIREDMIEVPVQINGKLRSRVTVPADAADEALRSAALADEKIRELIQGKQIRKIIVIPKKLVNIVVG